jgi:DNA-binding winged helix-turn-helix (wHTH) protein
VNQNEISLSPEITFIQERSCLSSPGQEDIHLTPNERRLLELIISGKGKKETIIEEIWHSRGTIVGESSYHQLIKMLRRKLQIAGLPYSVIKTIPRHGITLNLTKCPEPEERVLNSPAHEEIAVEVVADAGNAELTVLPELTLSQLGREKLNSGRFIHEKKLVLFGLVIFMLPTLLTCVYKLVNPEPQAFPFESNIGEVTFHLSSLRGISSEVLEQRRSKLPKSITNVYIASNGPKFWVAECEGELSKENKCRYELYSSY